MLQLFSDVKIAILAPAGAVDGPKSQSGIALLREWGAIIHEDPTLTARDRYLAGSDTLRATNFQTLWHDEDTQILWAARGGYGCLRLLDLIEWDSLRGKRKILLGHSDISILHLAFRRAGLDCSASTVMPAADLVKADDPLSRESLKLCLELLLRGDKQEEARAWPGLENAVCLRPGQAQGLLVPVTLSVLAAMRDHPMMPSLEGTILMLEDINEGAYRIDSYLRQIENAGLMHGVQAIIFGDFGACDHPEWLRQTLQEMADRHRIPTLAQVPFGHCIPRLNVPAWRSARLNVHPEHSCLMIQ